MIIETDKNEIDEHLKNPCVVDFYTTGCPNCEKIAPVFDEVSQQCDGVSFLKVNLDEDITLAERYGISHVPTLILFRHSEPIQVHEGYLDKQGLTAFIKGKKEAGA